MSWFFAYPTKVRNLNCTGKIKTLNFIYTPASIMRHCIETWQTPVFTHNQHTQSQKLRIIMRGRHTPWCIMQYISISKWNKMESVPYWKNTYLCTVSVRHTDLPKWLTQKIHKKTVHNAATSWKIYICPVIILRQTYRMSNNAVFLLRIWTIRSTRE